jgi:lysophospholipase L1-like esterase
MKIKLLVAILLLTLFAFRPAEITWTALGDSITYLNDHRNETGGRITKGYVTRVTDQLPDVHYINQGHNGWSAVAIAQHIDQLGLQKSAVYTVFLGTNDWWQGQPAGNFDDYVNNTGTATFYGAYRTIIDKIRSLNPEAKIILITPMQRQDFVYINDPHNNAYGSYKAKNNQTLDQFADAVLKIGKYEHYSVVNLYYKSGMKLKNLVKFKRLKDSVSGEYINYKYPHFENVSFNPDKDDYPYPLAAVNFTYDGLHPSDKGCQVIADMLVKAMKHELKAN